MLRRLLDSPQLYFIGAGVLLVIAIASQFELQIPSRAKGSVDDIVALSERDDLNVIFLVVDTLRSDRLGIYGYDRSTSPVLDGLAAAPVVAEDAWTGLHGLTAGNSPLCGPDAPRVRVRDG